MEIFFWVLIFFIIATYPGYITVLVLLNKIIGKDIVQKDIEPSVSLIIAAYNEESVIKDKIINSLELDYPKEKLEIIIVSDCSSDKTDEIVKGYESERLKFIGLEKRGGKTAAQNESLKYVKGEILVFSDADIMYSKNAIRKLVQNFYEPSIGCVGGKLRYGSDRTIEGVKEKRMYSSFDQYIKYLESRIKSCIGVDGAIYAVRKTLARPFPEWLTSDFLTPLDVISQGYRVVFEDEALTFAEIASSAKAEFQRKIRTVKVGITVLYAKRELLNLFRYPWASFFLLFHKVFRWIIPYIMILLFLDSIVVFESGFLYQLIFYLQLMFYSFAIIGIFFRKRKPVKIFTVPFYFCLYNSCAIIGFFKFLFAKKSEIWEINR